MNICFMCPHTRISGGVKVIFRLANRLQRIGHDVTVLVEKYNDKNMFWFGEKINFKLEKVSRNSMELVKPDVVVNYSDGTSDLPLDPKTKHLLLLQSYGLHNTGVEEKNIKYKYHAVICVSNWLADVAKANGHTNVFVVHPGIDSIFRYKKEARSTTPIIGTLFHKLLDKNFALFVETMKMITIKYKRDAKTVILSAFGIEPIKELDAYSISNAILCNPPQFYLPFMYSTCDVWMSPSIREGFGLTTIEAMACCCPVVTVANKGLDDYTINEGNCCIIKTADEAAQAIIRIIGDEKFRNRLVNGGLALAKKFSWRQTTEQFESILRKIV